MLEAILPLLLSLSLAAGQPPAQEGLYVEARSASVFAGACHYNSELVNRGGEALLAWRFERGTHAGVDLAGVRVAAVVVGERNLVLEGARPTSVLYADGGDAAARAAAVALVRARHASVLGRVRALERAPLAVEQQGERYAVRVGDVASLSGVLMADRACCSMPLMRWYEPFSAVPEPVVGQSADFEHKGSRWIERRWRSSGQNDAQVGRFAW